MKILKTTGISILALFIFSASLCYGQTDYEVIEELIQWGKEYGCRGDFKEAREAFKKADELYQSSHPVGMGRFSEPARQLRIIEYVDQKKIRPFLAEHYFKATYKLERFSPECEQAIDYYNKIVEQNPDDPSALFIRGHIYYYYGGRKIEGDKAISDYSRALEMNPEFSDACFMRGTVYHDKGQHDNAIPDYSRAIEIDPEQSEYFFHRGLAYYDKRRYDNAITDFSKAIDLKNDYLDAYLRRGSNHFLNGNFQNAISDFGRAIEINHDILDRHSFEILYSFFHDFYSKREEYGRAMSAFKKTETVKPEKDNEYVARGYLYFTCREYDRAVTDFNSAIDLNPENDDYYRFRAYIYAYILCEYDRAVSDYSRIIDLKPDDASSYADRGDFHMMLGKAKEMNWHEKAASGAEEYSSSNVFTFTKRGMDFWKELASDAARGAFYRMLADIEDINFYEKAVFDYSRAIELAPEYINYYRDRAEAYAGMSKYKEAIADYNRTVEAEMNSGHIPSLYSFIGLRADFYAGIGKYEEAVADYSRVIEGRGEKKAYEKRLEVNTLLGRYDEVIADYSKIIEISPGDGNAYLNRGDFYEETGDLENACADWRKACDLDKCKRWSIINRIRCLGK